MSLWKMAPITENKYVVGNVDIVVICRKKIVVQLQYSTVVKDGLYEQRKLKLSFKKWNVEVLKNTQILYEENDVWHSNNWWVWRVCLMSMESLKISIPDQTT